MVVVYTLLQNGHNFSILLFSCKLALVASFKGKYFLNFEFKNEATRANLQEKKRILKWRLFWNKVNSSILDCLFVLMNTTTMIPFMHVSCYYYLISGLFSVEKNVPAVAR